MYLSICWSAGLYVYICRYMIQVNVNYLLYMLNPCLSPVAGENGEDRLIAQLEAAAVAAGTAAVESV